MNLEDVSNDPSVVGWLRQSGHGHIVDHQQQYSSASSGANPPILNGHGQLVDHQQQYSSGQARVSSPVVTSYHNATSYGDSYNQSTSVAHNPYPNPALQDIQYNRPTSYVTSPTQFLAPYANQPQYDMDVENLRRDPNTQIVHQPPQNDVVYRQRVFVRYLQPPTPPVAGTIIVREKQAPPPPPDPPLIIRRAAPPPPTPPPVVIRERPPVIPPPEPTTIIEKILPPLPKPPRQVIIEQYPPLPPKPQNIILERWLPLPPRQRRILYERAPAPVCQPVPRPIVVQHTQPQIRVQREVITEPCVQCHQQVACQCHSNSILSQVGVGQQIYASPSSSLISYNPYSALQTYGSISQPQSNVIITQTGYPNAISSSSYGMPLSCACHSTSIAGLDAYGAGVTTIPTVGHCYGQSTVYNVPENVPIDSVLRQFGVDSHSVCNPPTIICPASNIVTYVNSGC